MEKNWKYRNGETPHLVTEVAGKLLSITKEGVTLYHLEDGRFGTEGSHHDLIEEKEEVIVWVNVWRDKDEMTDEEKKNVKGWETMGGYLKTLSYKEAWAEGWKNATQEQRDWYKSLPNFDPQIFKEITGIDTETRPSLKGKKVKVEIDGEQFTATLD